VQRLEASSRGQLLISAGIVVLLVCIVIQALPLFGVRDAVTEPAQPLIDLAALEQNWGMFAPNPRNTQYELRVVLAYPDGSRWTWTAPSGGPFISPARDYRWRKWTENALATPLLRAQTARWVARTAPRRGAVRADVLLRTRPVNPPGPDPPRRWMVQRSTVELGGPA
jgi:hypothetical protein